MRFIWGNKVIQKVMICNWFLIAYIIVFNTKLAIKNVVFSLSKLVNSVKILGVDICCVRILINQNKGTGATIKYAALYSDWLG
jgi:hypothetical protein